MKRLVIDIATKRIIYFTENINEQLVEVEKTIIYDYIGEWPEECRLENCWNFRLEGDKIVDTSPVKKEEPKNLIEHNREQAINFLIDKINRNRNNLFSKCIGGDIVRALKLNNDVFVEQLARAKNISTTQYKKEMEQVTKEQQEKLMNTEINREFYLARLNNALTSEEILDIRDEFANKDLTVLQDYDFEFGAEI
jgi:transketolase